MAGRKSKWDELEMDEKLILVEGWARDGLTEKQIADNLGVSVKTIERWKSTKSQFSRTLKKGKEVIDRKVENALLKTALGYDYEEDTVTNKGDVVTVRKVQHPNTTALIFWLKNRKPSEWRDKQNVEHSGSVTNKNVDLSYLTDEQLEKELRKYEE